MAEARCVLSDLPVSMCGLPCHRNDVARHGDVRPDLPVDRVVGVDLDVTCTTAAKYPGRCASCGRWFSEGRPIGFSPAVEGWVADCCARELG